MKIFFNFAIFALVAFAIANAADSSDCDPDGNGKPTCSASVPASQTFRNNWDPTHYWQCSGTQVESVPCPILTGYDPITNTCISWNQWQWVPPCPVAVVAA